MKLPRNVSGEQLAKALKLLGYEITRQTGSHFRLTTSQRGEHGQSRVMIQFASVRSPESSTTLPAISI